MMGREQELIQAVKNGDVPGVQKLVAKVKAPKSSEYCDAIVFCDCPAPISGVTRHFVGVGQCFLANEAKGMAGARDMWLQSPHDSLKLKECLLSSLVP